MFCFLQYSHLIFPCFLSDIPLHLFMLFLHFPISSICVYQLQYSNLIHPCFSCIVPFHLLMFTLLFSISSIRAFLALFPLIYSCLPSSFPSHPSVLPCIIPSLLLMLSSHFPILYIFFFKCNIPISSIRAFLA